ncbi:MAG TPA: VWA domain-containing protein [Bryobacteraceae bacterium]|nr:VWA domain-containing protein [Bryobacteraceae bacterium]
MRSVRPAISFLLVPLAMAQTANIRVDTTLVVVPVTVTDSMNRFVLGLAQQDFNVFEDNTQQKVTHFSGEDAPLSVGLLVDTSGSMGMKLSMSRDAVREFLKTLNAEDEAFLIEFSDHARVAQRFTNRTQEIEQALSSFHPGGLTALLDAVNLGLEEMKHARNARKALIVISDGGDNNSRYSQEEIRSLVREADVQLYAMGVFEAIFFPTLSKEEVSGPRLLSQISEQTGGRAFGASDSDQLPGIAEKIAIELHNEYVLAYSPANQIRDGKYHKVDVKLQQPPGLPEIKARWRLGYYAPQP